jgi:hypothetical protein
MTELARCLSKDKSVEEPRSSRAEPKSMGWRVRARVGERVPWYEEPEEVAHDEFAAAAATEPNPFVLDF